MSSDPENQSTFQHLACEAGHQTLFPMRRGVTPLYRPGLCAVCELPLADLGEAPADLYGRSVTIDDGRTPLAPSPSGSGSQREDETPLVALRNHVASTGFSFILPEARAKVLSAKYHVEIWWLMKLGPQSHLLAVLETSRTSPGVSPHTTLFAVTGYASGTWEIAEYQSPPWAGRTTTKPLPVGLPPEDLHLFQALETFIREERCHDTSLYTPAAWKRRGDAIRKGAVLTVVSEGSSGLVQRHHFGYGYDRAFSQRLDLLLLKHGVVAELEDHLTLHLFRRT